MDLSNVRCFRCKQTGHRKADCPHRQDEQHRPPPAPRATAAPDRYRRTDLIECPVCQRDWIAVFTSPTQHLFTAYCPWCRQFEMDEDRVPRRRSS